MTVSVKDICEVLFDLEEKYDLNYQEIQGCLAWQLMRFSVYLELTKKLGIFGAVQQRPLSLFDKVKSFMPFLKNSLLFNPLSGNYKKDILIFDHPRKVMFEGEFVDIYSYFIVDFIKGNYSFEVLESAYFNEHFTKRQDYIKYTDRIELGSYIYKKRNKLEFTPSEKKLINDIKAELKNAFDVDIDIVSILTRKIQNLQYDYMMYAELFKKRNPKMVFVVVAYLNQAIVEAAKDLGIDAIELQHGTISDYHLGYSYPPKTRKRGEIAYFPNKIFTFGDYWINDETSPISKQDVIPIGFPYFEVQSKDFINIEPHDNQILFISQGAIGKYLSKLAYEFACEMKDFKIVYKLHSGEYETWRENYPYLLNDLENFEVIDNSEIPLYQLFAESTYQVGAFSTAIYEGLMFNCKTFIVDVPGIEHISDLIDNGYVCKITDSADLINMLDSFSPKDYDKDFFFKNFDIPLFKEVIDNE